MAREQLHINGPVPVSPGRVVISDEVPLDTVALRGFPEFAVADPEGVVPDVMLASAPLNPRDRPRRQETRIGIHVDGERVGALNLVQQPSGTTWLRDVRIDAEQQGKRLGLATYLGVITAAHQVGRTVRSDPHGLSPDKDSVSPARRVWESLVRRGIAEVIPGEHDQHGNPRFVSRRPVQ